MLQHNVSQDPYCYSSNVIVVITLLFCVYFVYSVTIGYNDSSSKYKQDTSWQVQAAAVEQHQTEKRLKESHQKQ